MDKVYSVSNVNKYIKMMFDKDPLLVDIAIKGEITNFKAHYTGHLYFTLKDNSSTIKCVMFKGYAGLNKFKPKDGDSVIITGSISSFERDGVYQVYVKSMSLDGLGDLYLKYEELKQKLKQEGLFNPEYKKKIPFLPNRVGVITSKTGAVIRDIINVSTRRYNNVNLLVYPAAVQGVNTAETVVKGIETFNIMENKVDVIIIARGGGSFEDLFGFNDENLARAIFKSKIPIVSAVGHETDFTICDFVSDLRAPTPSAAAELVYPSKLEILSNISNLKIRLNSSIQNMIDRRKQFVKNISTQRLIKTPQTIIQRYTMIIDSNIRAMENTVKLKQSGLIKEYSKYVALLDSYSPLKTLARGYSVVTSSNTSKVIKSKKDVLVGENINIQLEDGKIEAQVI